MTISSFLDPSISAIFSIVSYLVKERRQSGIDVRVWTLSNSNKEGMTKEQDLARRPIVGLLF